MRDSELRRAFKAGYSRGKRSYLDESIAFTGNAAKITDPNNSNIELWVNADNKVVRVDSSQREEFDNDHYMYYNVDTRDFDISSKEFWPITDPDRYVTHNAGNLYTVLRAKVEAGNGPMRKGEVSSKHGQLNNIRIASKILQTWTNQLKNSINGVVYEPNSNLRKGKGNDPKVQRWFDREFVVLLADLMRLVRNAKKSDKAYQSDVDKVMQGIEAMSSLITQVETQAETAGVDDEIANIDDDSVEYIYQSCNTVKLSSDSIKKYKEILSTIGLKSGDEERVIESVFANRSSEAFPKIAIYEHDSTNHEESSVYIHRERQMATNIARQNELFFKEEKGFYELNVSTIPFTYLDISEQKNKKKLSIDDYKWSNLKGYKEDTPADIRKMCGKFNPSSTDGKYRYIIMLRYAKLSSPERDRIISLMQSILDDITEVFASRAVIDDVKKFIDKTTTTTSSILDD